MIKKFRRTLKENKIVRRYIVVNSFDGTLAVMAIIVANFLVGTNDPKIVILPSIGASFAMFISGVWSAYLSEESEFKKSVLKIEKHLLKRLKGTKVHEDMKKNVFIVSIFNGLSPLLSGIIIISPFFVFGEYSYYISFFLSALILFSLGIFMADVVKGNRLVYGLKTLTTGLVVGLFFYILTIIGLL